MNRLGSRTVVAGLLCAGLCACASPGPDARCSLEGVDWNGLREAAPLRAHVRLVSGENDMRLDVVVRMNSDELVVVGLTHYGVRLFVVRQQGESVRVEDTLSADHEIVAVQVLDALRRGSGTSASELAGEGKPVSIRYARTGRGPGFEIHEPQCGYQASVVGVSGNLPAWNPVAPEGVEP